MEFLDTAQAAEILGVSGARVRQLCAQNRIGTKVADVWVFTREELEAFKRVPRPTGRPPGKGKEEGE